MYFKISDHRFLAKFHNIYQEKHELNDQQFNQLLNFKCKRRIRFFSLYDGDHLLGFFSLTRIDENIFELGDVTKVQKNLQRSEFSSILNKVCNRYYKMGFAIVGFPNKYALPMELNANFKIVARYHKCIGLRFLIFEFSNILIKAQRGLSVGKPKFQLRASNLRFTRRRFVFVDGGNSRWVRFLPSMFIEYHKTNESDGFPYISYKGINSRLLQFRESDNSA